MNDNITEINKDTFWKLIQSAKETCGQDMDAMMDFLKDRLVSMLSLIHISEPTRH